MMSFSERNPVTVGAIGLALVTGVVAFSLEYKNLPFVDTAKNYSAYFAEAGGLKAGSPVEVAGSRVGQVNDITLDGPRVLVTFDVDESVHLGNRTEAAIKAKSLLGSKLIDITPRGDGDLSGTIPLQRTRSPYQLPDALGDLAATISGLDTGKVSDALATIAGTFKDTPADLKVALDGVSRFSQSLDARDTQLRSLLANANKVTGVLSEHADQIVGLIANADSLLVELRSESAALDAVMGNISAATQQISGLIKENRANMKPVLDKLNGILTIVNNRKERIQKALPYLNGYAMSLGESVASGPFFKAYVTNLLPGQFVQPFVDAAFSDLGLDPNVLLPSQRIDPQTGQPGTPALPVPYPRTGQGGEPHLTLPDAITGKPGDPRYPYREPLPAPAPGGPPPGPPATAPPVGETQPTPSPVSAPAPGEAPAAPAAPQGPDQ
ncbi:mammalian cell entry protein [Mycobacterium sp. CBMA 234]|uniref:MCE family protein n=1 Tax=Mycolicibacterium sp. CBMA 234 TaxID=1918495 RepID=UPI0012DE5E85|nr:MCE family protein [Mycolicibacterium sp. CBMA 234]MUL65953.1 mammalian cell entry protein [Mycolicibacterium sp. CBMA 234]